MKQFVRESALFYYPNSLCFEDKSKVVLHNNWFSDKYHNPLVMLEECRNTTANGNKCATHEEIKDYVSNTIFYFQRQDNVVDKEMYEQDVKNTKVLYDADGNYFPIRIFQKSMFYRTLGY